MAPVEFDTPGFIARMEAYAAAIPAGSRRVVALAGAPGAGKSTLAGRLEEWLDATQPGVAALLPMDGFHYDDEVLGPRGWQSRKGAPHTFDVGGYISALQRLRANAEETVAVPRFDRSIEIARAGAILIEQDVRLIITEGNYLLLGDEPWPGLRAYFDVAILVVAEMATLEARNRQRWVEFGLDEPAIRAKLEDNDLPNARLIYERSTEPDWIVHT